MPPACEMRACPFRVDRFQFMPILWPPTPATSSCVFAKAGVIALSREPSWPSRYRNMSGNVARTPPTPAMSGGKSHGTAGIALGR